jgi:PHP family Zn ribbon phosphoesterase
MRHKMNLHPWDEVLANMHEQRRLGHDVYQQFLCEKCGTKLMMEAPNDIHETGTCDRCGHLTDIKKNGMNFMVALKIGG